jgi:hypothetical protein
MQRWSLITKPEPTKMRPESGSQTNDLAGDQSGSFNSPLDSGAVHCELRWYVAMLKLNLIFGSKGLESQAIEGFRSRQLSRFTAHVPRNRSLPHDLPSALDL